jgi:dolichol-phosphate mannosyltransferase
MKLSVVIPARNEEGSIGGTVNSIVDILAREEIDYEILVVDDGSSDRTAMVGFAVRTGLECYTGDAVAIMMADGSDSPEDLLAYYRLLMAGYDCAFGSRFMPGGGTHGYPPFKLVVNRIVNLGIRLAFGHRYNDTTNAFKAYRREVIESVQPLISRHFNLTVEIPLKAVVRGHSYAIIPISWTDRKTGVSKLRLQEMGSRYLFIVLYVFFEHHLSKGDYMRADRQLPAGRAGWRVGSPAARAHTRSCRDLLGVTVSPGAAV